MGIAPASVLGELLNDQYSEKAPARSGDHWLVVLTAAPEPVPVAEDAPERGGAESRPIRRSKNFRTSNSRASAMVERRSPGDPVPGSKRVSPNFLGSEVSTTMLPASVLIKAG